MTTSVQASSQYTTVPSSSVSLASKAQEPELSKAEPVVDDSVKFQLADKSNITNLTRLSGQITSCYRHQEMVSLHINLCKQTILQMKMAFEDVLETNSLRALIIEKENQLQDLEAKYSQSEKDFSALLGGKPKGQSVQDNNDYLLSLTNETTTAIWHLTQMEQQLDSLERSMQKIRDENEEFFLEPMSLEEIAVEIVEEKSSEN